MRRRRTRTSPLASIVVVGALLVFGALAVSKNLGGIGSYTAYDPPATTTAVPVGPTSAGPTSAAPVSAAAARTALTALRVAPWATAAGYDREGDFGEAWLDVDRNGCDTRNDILARDLTQTVRASNCKVLSGSFVSPYTGQHIDFVKGERTSELVQIDHLVALSDAWRTGAQQLSQSQRVALANDPLELLAVDGTSNDSKGAQDAASWLPDNAGYRCAYVTRQIQVKAKYHLWVTPAERWALARVLTSCP